MTDITPAEIIAFWSEAGPDKWWTKDGAFDAEIAARFGDTHRRAAAGMLDRWSETPDGALALVLVLDQFSRNLFRNDKRAFAQDAHARRIAEAALTSGFDFKVAPALRQFLYMPFMHSEVLGDQARAVALFNVWAEENLKYAEEHRAIIARFGRFPHRNSILDRTTTPEEQEFLDGGGFKG